MDRPNPYYVGGAIPTDAPLYVVREADRELLTLCRSGRFVYIFGPRQMGKTSLLVRTARSLDVENIPRVFVDLSTFGQKLTAERWYLNLIYRITDELGLPPNLAKWWEQRNQLSLTERLGAFFAEVVLKYRPRLVVFIDEFDYITSLPYAADILSSLRALHQRGMTDPLFMRLSFVLSGGVTPGSLPHAPTGSPFNIAYVMELTDFTHGEALPLAAGLGLPSKQAERVLELILGWTGGHPYLTQRLCYEVAKQGRTSWSEADVERVVRETFIDIDAAEDHNLRFVSDMLRRSPQAGAVLKTYGRIMRGQTVGEVMTPALSYLRSSGVVRHDRGWQVRNRIYREVFNEKWLAGVWYRLKPLDDLNSREREVALNVLPYLVTPSGARTAQTVAELSRPAKQPRRRVAVVLNHLTEVDILRRIEDAPTRRTGILQRVTGGPTDDRYEIASDELTAEIKEWLEANGRSAAGHIAAPSEVESSAGAETATASAPDEPYLFYLSYAHLDAGDYLTKFYRDLREAIRSRAGAAREDRIGFYDRAEIAPGESWNDAVADALRSSRALLCVFSPDYFKSEWCGKELQVFTSRVYALMMQAMSDAMRTDAAPPPVIIPVLWSSPEGLPRPLPDAVSLIPHLNSGLGEIYNSEGLRGLMQRAPRNRDDYERVVQTLAEQVLAAANYALPPLPEQVDLGGIESAFPPAWPPFISPPVSGPSESGGRGAAGAGPATGRWVLVAGTGKVSLPGHVNNVAREVGRALAERGYGLVVGGWAGVDYVLAEEFSATLEAADDEVDDCLVQVVTVGARPAFKGGRVVEVGGREAEYEEALNRADAVILIGGLGGTYSTFVHATMRPRPVPVFPVASTGGDALKAFESMRDEWERLGPPGVGEEEFSKLNRPLRDDADARQLTQDLFSLIDRLWRPAHAPAGRADALARIVFVKGDLLDQRADAIVNAVGVNPSSGGAIGAKLMTRLRPAVFTKLSLSPPLKTGETLLSKVEGELPAGYVIHVCAEEAAGRQTVESSARAVTGALAEADRLGLRAVAFAAVGTGAAALGAWKVALPTLEAAAGYVERGSGLEKIIFAFISEDTYRAYLKAFQQLDGEPSARVLIPRFSDSSRHALLLAEALRDHLRQDHVSTSLLLWGLFQKEGGAARELLEACAGPEVAEAALNEWVGTTARAHDLSIPPAAALAHVAFSPDCEAALVRAFELAGDEALVVRERQTLAGLLGVPESAAAAWLAELSGLSSKRLWEIVAVAGEEEGAPVAEAVRESLAISAASWRLALGAPQAAGLPVAEPRVGERISITLELLPAPADGGSAGRHDAVLRVPANALELTGFINASGFQLHGDNVFTIPVAGGRPVARSFTFELVPLLSGQRAVEVEVYPGRVPGLLPASVGLTLRVVSPLALPDITELIDRRRVPNPQPDVMLYVALEETPAGQRTRPYLTCHRLGLDREPLDPLPLDERDLAALRRAATQAGVGAAAASPRDVLAALRACGAMLFERLVSGALLERYYEISELASLSPEPWSWLIISDEQALLPWELVCGYGVDPDTGLVWYDDFLAGKFLVSHWVGRRGLRLLGEAPLGKLGLIHYDQRPGELPRWLDALGGPDNVEAEEQSEQEEQEEQSGRLSLLQPGSDCYGLHVLRYAERRGSRQIVSADVENGRRPGARSKADDMTYEQRLDLTLRRPTVGLSFVNERASVDDRAAPAVRLESDWLLPLMHAGACALVGPRWPVAPEIDRLFAREFYAAVRAGEPLGLAVWRARQQARDAFPHSPEWLAYTYFGHPRCAPYVVRPAQGFTLFEAIDQPEGRPFRPGETYRFRASYRTEAPAWYGGRLRLQSEELEAGAPLSVLVMPLSGELPKTYALAPVAQSKDLQCTVPLTMPALETTLPVIVRFQKGDEELRTVTLNLQVKEGL